MSGNLLLIFLIQCHLFFHFGHGIGFTLGRLHYLLLHFKTRSSVFFLFPFLLLILLLILIFILLIRFSLPFPCLLLFFLIFFLFFNVLVLFFFAPVLFGLIFLAFELLQSDFLGTYLKQAVHFVGGRGLHGSIIK